MLGFIGGKQSVLFKNWVKNCLLILLSKSSLFVWLIMGLAMAEIESDDKTEKLLVFVTKGICRPAT